MTKNQIRQFREGLRRVITQYDVAEAVGISQAKMSLIEQGRISPSQDEKVKIAKALEVPVEELWPEERP